MGCAVLIFLKIILPALPIDLISINNQQYKCAYKSLFVNRANNKILFTTMMPKKQQPVLKIFSFREAD